MKFRIVFIGLFLALSACDILYRYETPPPGGWACPPLPVQFQESDLIGTWQAHYGSLHTTDTLVLRGDGTYKQIFVRSDGYRYESGWNRWWLERRPSGGLYLHLEGMHKCDVTDTLCRQEGGGGGDMPWWDPCEDRVFRMRGDVVLSVTGTPAWHDPVPRGIVLNHMLSGVSGFYFTLQE